MALLSLASWRARVRQLYRKLRGHLLRFDRSRVTVRLLRESDLATLQQRGPQAPVGTYTQDWLAQLTGQISMLVAWYGRRPIAVGLVHWPGPRQASVKALYPDCPEIFRLHVRSSYRSMGIGTLLIDEFERMARARGLDHIGLGVNYDNPEAFALYLRLGYGEPAPSDFMDEFDIPHRNGQVVHHSHKAHFLVKTL